MNPYVVTLEVQIYAESDSRAHEFATYLASPVFWEDGVDRISVSVKPGELAEPSDDELS